MKISKLLMSLVVSLLILSFAITTVGADVEPPVQRGSELEGGTDSISIDTVPIAPVGSFVYSRKPTFYFRSQPGATLYEVEVWGLNPFTYMYNYTGPATCPPESYYCYFQPPTRLPVRYSNNVDSKNGLFDWRVRAYTTSWLPWSSFTEPDFYVLSKGFDDDFSTSTGKWWIGNGPWTQNLIKGRIESNGTNDAFNNVYHQNAYVNFDYTVKMKRLVNVHDSNSIVVWGNPHPTAPSGMFDDGIYFSYSNAGDWKIRRTNDGVETVIQDWKTNYAAINEFGWNELRVRAIYPYLDFWINGVYLGWVYDNSLDVLGLNANTVGFDAFGVTPTEPLRVTSAVLTAINTQVLAEHDPAMQLGLNPVEVTADQLEADRR